MAMGHLWDIWDMASAYRAFTRMGHVWGKWDTPRPQTSAIGTVRQDAVHPQDNSSSVPGSEALFIIC